MTLRALTTTLNFSIYYDDSPSLNAFPQAQAIVNSCESDLSRLTAVMGAPLTPYGPSNRIAVNLQNPTVNLGAGGENSSYKVDGSMFINIAPSTDINFPDDFVRVVFIAELAEILNSERNLNAKMGWPLGTFVSEGISRVMAAGFYPAAYYDPRRKMGPVVNGWLDARDYSYVDAPIITPPTVLGSLRESGKYTEVDGVGFGVATLFLNYLRYQLNHQWDEIIRSGASTLTLTYQNLTGLSTGTADFTALIEKFMPTLPAGSREYYLLLNDNPFPLGAPKSASLNLQTVPTGPMKRENLPRSVSLKPCWNVPEKSYPYDVIDRPQKVVCSLLLDGFLGVPTVAWSVNSTEIYDTPTTISAFVVTEDPNTGDFPSLSDIAASTVALGTGTGMTPVQVVISANTTTADFESPIRMSMELSILETPGRMYLNIEARAAEIWSPDTTIVNGVIVVDTMWILYGGTYYDDKAACRKRLADVYNKYVQLPPIAYLKNLPDPPPQDWINALQWLELVKRELLRIQSQNPRIAQQIARTIETAFGVTLSATVEQPDQE